MYILYACGLEKVISNNIIYIKQLEIRKYRVIPLSLCSRRITKMVALSSEVVSFKSLIGDSFRNGVITVSFQKDEVFLFVSRSYISNSH